MRKIKRDKTSRKKANFADVDDFYNFENDAETKEVQARPAQNDEVTKRGLNKKEKKR